MVVLAACIGIMWWVSYLGPPAIYVPINNLATPRGFGPLVGVDGHDIHVRQQDNGGSGRISACPGHQVQGMTAHKLRSGGGIF